MLLRNKFFLTVSIVYLFSVIFVVGWLTILFFGAKTEMAKFPSEQVMDLEFGRLQAIVDGKAENISMQLNNYYQEVEYLKKRYAEFQKDYKKYDFSVVENVYPEKSNDGFVHYGYVSPAYGAYADYDLRGSGSPWLPRRVVQKATSDKKYQDAINHDLNLVSLFNAPFKLVAEKYKKEMDLVWIVLDNGTTNVYPPYDYSAILKKDPKMADIDESTKDYVRLLNPENNPEKKTLWLNPYFDFYRKSWMTSVVAPIYQDDKFIGTVGADILLKSLTSDIVNLNFANSSYVFLIDNDGKPIAFPEKAIDEIIDDNDIKLALKEALKPLAEQNWNDDLMKSMSVPVNNVVKPEWKEVINKILAGERFTKVLNTNQREVTVSIAPIAGTNWGLGVVVPAEDVFLLSKNVDSLTVNVVGRMWKFSFLVLLAGVILMLVASFWGCHNIVNPILQLTKDVGGVDLADSKAISNNIKRNDEIGILRREFNNMIIRLREEAEKRKKAEGLLQEKLDSLEKSNRLMMGREKKIAELKEQLRQNKTNE